MGVQLGRAEGGGSNDHEKGKVEVGRIRFCTDTGATYLWVTAKHLTGERNKTILKDLLLAQGLSIQSLRMKKASWQGSETADHISSIVRIQRLMNTRCLPDLPAIPSFLSGAPEHAHNEVSFPQVTLPRNTVMDPQRCVSWVVLNPVNLTAKINVYKY